MTAELWSQVFDLVRAFVVAGVSIGLVSALVAAASTN